MTIMQAWSSVPTGSSPAQAKLPPMLPVQQLRLLKPQGFSQHCANRQPARMCVF